MTHEEKASLRNAVLSIGDPRGNWDYGWRIICEMAEVDPLETPAPFRKRDLETEFLSRGKEESPQVPPRRNIPN
jgi:hypothetical protein